MQSFQKLVRCCTSYQFYTTTCPLSMRYFKEQLLSCPHALSAISPSLHSENISVSTPAPSQAQKGRVWLQPQPWQMLSNSSTGFSSDTTLGSYQHFISVIYLPYHPQSCKTYLLHKHWMAQLLGSQCKISWESGRFKVKAFLVIIFNLCFNNTGKGPIFRFQNCQLTESMVPLRA